jgi:hypothetical protein
LGQVQQAWRAELQAVRLPQGLVQRFDTQAAHGHVQKTTPRHIVTLHGDRFLVSWHADERTEEREVFPE